VIAVPMIVCVPTAAVLDGRRLEVVQMRVNRFVRVIARCREPRRIAASSLASSPRSLAREASTSMQYERTACGDSPPRAATYLACYVWRSPDTRNKSSTAPRRLTSRSESGERNREFHRRDLEHRPMCPNSHRYIGTSDLRRRLGRQPPQRPPR
jgi:hypothetical protein